MESFFLQLLSENLIRQVSVLIQFDLIKTSNCKDFFILTGK